MNLAEATTFLSQQVPNPSDGLPDEVFYYISRTTPLVNVDLLIKDENGRVLLAWRDDCYCGKGWHVPGGIIRFRETLEERLQKVAVMEVGTEVKFDSTPLTVKQCIHFEREERSHFISFLYKCFLPSSFNPDNRGRTPADTGYLQWHERKPSNLLSFHEMYREYL